MFSPRELVDRFFELPSVVRVGIAKGLGLYDEREGNSCLTDWLGVWVRAKQANKVHALWDKVNEAHAELGERRSAGEECLTSQSTPASTPLSD